MSRFFFHLLPLFNAAVKIESFNVLTYNVLIFSDTQKGRGRLWKNRTFLNWLDNWLNIN